MSHLLEEPRGDDWRDLLEVSLGSCDTFLLVVRPSLPISQAALAVLDRLRPFLLEVSSAAEWPGTRLLEGAASVYQYTLSPASAHVVASVAASPFAWVQPELPEDLCLLRPDGHPWLVTTTHERDAYLVLSPAELTALLGSLPGLSLSPARDIP